MMETTSLLMFLLIGALAGWIAGNLMKGGGFGLLRNILLGIIGAVIGGWIFGMLGVATNGFIGSLITAVIGASLLLFAVGLINK